MSNLSSFDFHWTHIDIGSRAGYFGDSQPTAKLGEHVLQLPSLQAGEKLIEPGLLVKVPSGRGSILFDTLAWEGALGGETDKVVRVVSSLAANMGAAIRLTQEKSYNYFHVDLKPHATRSYYDEIAGDGKGGWNDQGINDMRFFLINHTGLAQGMDVGTGEFPASVVFAGRPFTPIDPKKNNNRAVVMLRGKEHDAASPERVTGISVNQKAHRLWFLHTSMWSGNKVGEELGRYVVRYADGTQSVFSIRNKIEIGDLWTPAPLSGAKVGWVGRNGQHSPSGCMLPNGITHSRINLLQASMQSAISQRDNWL
jgi:beta-galactosidase